MRQKDLREEIALMLQGCDMEFALTMYRLRREYGAVHGSDGCAVMYHGTSEDRLPSILRSGLQPRQERGLASGPAVYFDANPDYAFAYAREAAWRARAAGILSDPNPVLLAIAIDPDHSAGGIDDDVTAWFEDDDEHMHRVVERFFGANSSRACDILDRGCVANWEDGLQALLIRGLTLFRFSVASRGAARVKAVLTPSSIRRIWRTDDGQNWEPIDPQQVAYSDVSAAGQEQRTLAR